MKDLIIKLLGLKIIRFFGDLPSYDRWRWLKSNLRTGSLRTLDAGCGSGTFTMYAASIGNEAIGISFESSNIEKAQHRAKLLGLNNIQFISYDLKNLSSISNNIGLFDQVICFETIEHIMDDHKLIADISALIKPGGRLLLTTPYKYYRHLIGDKISEIEDGGHVRWGYTFDEVSTIFSNCALKVEMRDYLSGFVSQQICNFQRILSFVFGPFSWFIAFPFRLLLLFDKPITKVLNYPYLCIAIVGLKEDGLGK